MRRKQSLAARTDPNDDFYANLSDSLVDFNSQETRLRTLHRETHRGHGHGRQTNDYHCDQFDHSRKQDL